MEQAVEVALASHPRVAQKQRLQIVSVGGEFAVYQDVANRNASEVVPQFLVRVRLVVGGDISAGHECQQARLGENKDGSRRSLAADIAANTSEGRVTHALA